MSIRTRIRGWAAAVAGCAVASPLLPLVLLVAGTAWVLLVPTALSPTYSDENALLVSMGTPRLPHPVAAAVLASIRNASAGTTAASVPSPPPLAAFLTRWTGVPFHTFAYSLHADAAPSAPPLATGSVLYAVYRPPRADGKEAIILTASVDIAACTRAVAPGGGGLAAPSARPAGAANVEALLLTVERLQSAGWLARSIVLVLTDAPVDAPARPHPLAARLPRHLASSIGLQLWLRAYHGQGADVPSGLVRYPSLAAHGGAVIALVGVDLPNGGGEAWTAELIGIDGLLPNMDLVYIALRALEQAGARVSVPRADAMLPTLDAAANLVGLTPSESRILSNMASFLSAQAATLPRVPSAVAAAHALPAVTLSAAAPAAGPKDASAVDLDIMRIVRATLVVTRSLSNLIESFHASFRLYILGTQWQFISYGDYVWPLVVIVASVLVSAIGSYTRLTPDAHALVTTALILVASNHVLGIAALAAVLPLAHTLAATAAALSLPAATAAAAALLATTATAAAFGLHAALTHPPTRPRLWPILRTMVLLEAVWVTVCGSLLNLGLASAFIAAIIAAHLPVVPVLSTRGVVARAANTLQLCVVMAASPALVALVAVVATAADDPLAAVVAAADAAALQWTYQPTNAFYLVAAVYWPINLTFAAPLAVAAFGAPSTGV